MTHRFSITQQLFVFGVALAVILFAGVQTAFAVGTNGSFETGTDPGAFATLVPGDTDITDWTVVSGTLDYIGTYWQASDGTRSIDMNGTDAGSISQDLPTVVGATYDVTFDLSGNPDGGVALKELSVSANGDLPQNYSYNTSVEGNTTADMKWASSTYSFVATTTSTTLTFTSLIAGAFGPALDNVLITETLPPPPPPPAGCCCGSSSSGNVSIINGFSIVVNQSGCITNTTSSSASTGGNSAGGSTGGNGGRGGDVRVRTNGGNANGNNGAATAGAGGPGGVIVTGGASSSASTVNLLNRVRIRINF